MYFTNLVFVTKWQLGKKYDPMCKIVARTRKMNLRLFYHCFLILLQASRISQPLNNLMSLTNTLHKARYPVPQLCSYKGV